MRTTSSAGLSAWSRTQCCGSMERPTTCCITCEAKEKKKVLESVLWLFCTVKLIINYYFPKESLLRRIPLWSMRPYLYLSPHKEPLKPFYSFITPSPVIIKMAPFEWRHKTPTKPDEMRREAVNHRSLDLPYSYVKFTKQAHLYVSLPHTRK